MNHVVMAIPNRHGSCYTALLVWSGVRSWSSRNHNGQEKPSRMAESSTDFSSWTLCSSDKTITPPVVQAFNLFDPALSYLSMSVSALRCRGSHGAKSIILDVYTRLYPASCVRQEAEPEFGYIRWSKTGRQAWGIPGMPRRPQVLLSTRDIHNKI